ncbi:MAG: DUF2868 domain-containing protein [Gammaproteobacteria bacterium]
MPRPSTSLFQDAIDIPQWLEADRQAPYAQRLRRDRDIARSMAAAAPARRVRQWWRSVGPPADPGAGERLDRMRGALSVAMVALGVVAGTSLALAAFRYDGSQPVNVVQLFALLVGLQILAILLTVLLIPRRAPVLRAVQDALATLSPGALAASISRGLLRAQPDLARLFDRNAARASAGRFARWQLLFWAQVAAVSFNVAVLATAVALVTFTDLAFGWSTTLDADPRVVSRIVEVLAWPWHAIVPGAVPGAELVERSQFFRLQGSGPPDPGASRTLAGWWPFTICAIVTYGLLPRIVLLVVSALRLRAAAAALLLDDPGVTALLDRMDSPALETSAAEHDAVQPGGAPAAALDQHSVSGQAQAIVWEDCLTPEAAGTYARERLGIAPSPVLQAGGGRALGADHDTLARIAAARPDTLVVFTPAWEPPLLEFLDFLAGLRRHAGAAATIIVTPVPEATRTVSDTQRDTWARAVGRLADPRLYLETGAA